MVVTTEHKPIHDGNVHGWVGDAYGPALAPFFDSDGCGLGDEGVRTARRSDGMVLVVYSAT
ncbi:hypothetical protein SMD44_p10240 (plasmid) [Streptomyces alboflavus]|uniref:Uncharacterized protein n=1 Tax=Streptomyces alboflavus TaxID=67267 RepID=A0A291W589_9ACTN|nr:hypothetical protein SMD44_p10240 [Streptomyces alboflavus]